MPRASAGVSASRASSNASHSDRCIPHSSPDRPVSRVARNDQQASILADLLSSAKLADSTLLYNYFKSLLAFETRAVSQAVLLLLSTSFLLHCRVLCWSFMCLPFAGQVNWFSLESGTADPNTFGTFDIEGQFHYHAAAAFADWFRAVQR